MTVAPFIRRVRLKNYKSIGACNVHFGPLTFLVGPNGAGKSNFLDALRFVTDSLRTSLDHALRERGGIKEVRRRSTGHPRVFGMRLDFVLPDGRPGLYSFEIEPIREGAYAVREEQCVVKGEGGFVHTGDAVVSTVEPAPAAASDRLYLVNASGLPQFRPVYDALSTMGFYNLNPDRIRDLQAPDPGDVLSRDGGNIASVIAQMSAQDPESKQRLEEYLSKVVPGMQGVDSHVLGPKLTLQFHQAVKGAKDPWRFLAANMSDGTLRAVGVLVALFQGRKGPKRVPLIGIEEPEIALHPAAAGALHDSLREASAGTQVVVTSHSPDLLDNDDITDAELLSVISEANETRIGPLDEAGRNALREHLYTAGELLRMSQLEPETSARTLVPEQLTMFEEPE